MEPTSLCLLLACLSVTPERSQFFLRDTVSLSCGAAEGWRVSRNTTLEGVRPCSTGWGTPSQGVNCSIQNAYPSDSGVYWCEAKGGAMGRRVRINVTDGPVILESPVRPVTEGDAVTLRCRAQKIPTSDLSADFYKDGVLIGTESTGEVTIHGVSASDEGLYKCSLSGLGESPQSWMSVIAQSAATAPTLNTPPVPAAASPSPSGPFLSVPRLASHVIVGFPYLLSTILLALICRGRATALSEDGRSSDVI